MYEISIKEARKIILLSQKIPPIKKKGTTLTTTLKVIQHLGYVQIDTISVIQRAHHHTLWNRNPSYKTTHINDLMASKQIFEYWSHAAAYLPMEEYRYSLPRKKAFANGIEKHWHTCDTQLMKFVLNRIAKEGPLMAKDFDGKGKKTGEWQTKPTKKALVNLFMQGELMISHRNNFQKVYDLTERVLPKNINTSEPNTKEHTRFLILKYLKTNGIGKASEMIYLLKNMKSDLLNVLEEMMLSNELLSIKVKKELYYALPSSLALLEKPLKRSSLKILSPFDNLLIQRKRTKELFNFDYLLECYVPAAKRKFGYFVLPILWNGNLIARMDCKVDRNLAVLHIYNLILEPSLKKTNSFIHALSKELMSFLIFNECKQIQLHKTNPIHIKEQLDSEIKKSL